MSDMHTPGPWAFETVKTSCGICHKIGPFPFNEKRESHACIYVDYMSDSNPIAIELKSNARLIAAAPDLLWFTEQIINGLDCEMLKIKTPADETLEIILKEGRASIAKARGQS